MDDPIRVNAIAAEVMRAYGHLLPDYDGDRPRRQPTADTKPKRDLTGQRFGMLIALAPSAMEKGRGWRWHCRCDCGKEVFPYGFSLLHRNTESCGCQRWNSPGRKQEEPA